LQDKSTGHAVRFIGCNKIIALITYIVNNWSVVLDDGTSGVGMEYLRDCLLK